MGSAAHFASVISPFGAPAGAADGVAAAALAVAAGGFGAVAEDSAAPAGADNPGEGKDTGDVEFDDEPHPMRKTRLNQLHCCMAAWCQWRRF